MSKFHFLANVFFYGIVFSIRLEYSDGTGGNLPDISTHNEPLKEDTMAFIGKKLPEFKLDAYNPAKEVFVTVTNEDLKGSYTVLIFYPADFTFVCPTELEDMQESYAELKKLGAEVYSVSVDTHFVHKAWHDNSAAISKIEYTMIGDSNKELTRELDLLDDSGKALRATLILDPENVIQTVEINADGIGRKANVNINKVKAAKYIAAHPGEACPAKWESEADATLIPGLDLVGKI